MRGNVQEAGVVLHKGYYLWGLLKAYEIQDRLVQNNFKNDSALTGALVRHIIMHNGDQALASKLALLLTMKADIDGLKEDRRATTNAVKGLTARIKTLEGKSKS